MEIIVSIISAWAVTAAAISFVATMFIAMLSSSVNNTRFSLVYTAITMNIMTVLVFLFGPAAITYYIIRRFTQSVKQMLRTHCFS